MAKQVDYWDSINLQNGKYGKVSLQEGIGDFLSQLKNDNGAQMAAQELPVSDNVVIIVFYHFHNVIV